MTLPICINCGKKIGKHILTVEIPFDADVVEAVYKKLGKRATIADKIETIRERQVKQAHEYEVRMERAKEARLKIAVGSNEFPVNNPQWAPSILERMNRQERERTAEDPPLRWFNVRVRVWLGEYGYDRKGLFHSGECARAWGTAVALELRKKGKL